MKIFSVRLGFACNSSSSHSIVLLRHTPEDDVEGQEFGWDYFTAASSEAKDAYFAQTVRASLREVMNDQMSMAVIHDLFGVVLDPNGYVDHQSLFTLPMSRDSKGLDVEFANDLRAWLQKPGMTILGGNDNDDDDHPLLGSATRVAELPIPQDDSQSKLWARKDPLGYWVVFNRATGAKIRFSFDNLAAVPVRASLPELVDLKITNYCPFGCEFCYQNSTLKGAVGDYPSSIVYALGQMGVFEIALGGGEPTLWPRLEDFVAYAHYEGMVVNITTKNIEWLYTPQAARVLPDLGAVAVSISDTKEVDRFLKAIKGKDGRFAVQIIDGLFSQFSVETILRQCAEVSVPVTFLGFKSTGRGAAYNPRNKGALIKVLQKPPKDMYMPGISIDTVFAHQYQAELAKLEVNPVLYDTQDGRYSMYIDAVENKAGPSSYNPEAMVSLSDRITSEEITKIFRSFSA